METRTSEQQVPFYGRVGTSTSTPAQQQQQHQQRDRQAELEYLAGKVAGQQRQRKEDQQRGQQQHSFNPAGDHGQEGNNASAADTSSTKNSVIDDEILEQQLKMEAAAAAAAAESPPRKRSFSSVLGAEAAAVGHPTPADSYSSTVATAAAAVSNTPEMRHHLLHSDSHGSHGSGAKLVVGTPEWHKQRRDNHKEVERRRRETINKGITALAEVVPSCDKNKGQILARSVEYISQLRESEAKSMERWTMEKLLTEQSLAELAQQNEKLKMELERAWKEVAVWKNKSQQQQQQQQTMKEGGAKKK